MEESYAQNINMITTQPFNSQTISGTHDAVESLYREIQIRDSIIHEVEGKYNMTCSTMSNLSRQLDEQQARIVELERVCVGKDEAFWSISSLLYSRTEELDCLNVENAYLKRRCHEMHADLRTLRDEMFYLNKSHRLESREKQATQLQNERLKSDIKAVEKELQQLVKGVNGVESDQTQSFPMSLVGSLQSHIRSLKTELEDKIDDIQYWQNLNETLTFREHMINNELVDARAELLSNLHTVVSSRTMIGIKRMGELNSKPFRDVCASKYAPEECDAKCAEVCSLWEEYFRDSLWHPFKHSIIDGSVQEIIDESDKRMEELRKEWGEDAYKAVTSALLELNEYNPSGRYPVSEIWNFREQRKASLKEVIGYIIQQLKTHKRKR